MNELYRWHTALVASFLGFVFLFVLGSVIRDRGSGKKP